MDFIPFKRAIAAQFASMQKHSLFRANVTGDALWDVYLSSFPDGTNPMFRKRTEHDCNCCKQFIRQVGNVVAIIDGKMVSLWEVKVPAEPGYQVVAEALAAEVLKHPIVNPFLHTEKFAGTDKNLESVLGPNGRALEHQHFFVNILPQFVAKKDAIPTQLGKVRTSFETLNRAVTEITPDAVSTVLDLIAQNSIYRGAEHSFAVTEFQKMQRAWAAIPAAQRDVFLWSKVGTTPGSVSGIRNTSIGTLLVDLSQGKDLEIAVKSFEAMVAPANYQRTTALVTPGMIKKAKEAIIELGLGSALARRHAVLSDFSINNVLWVDRNVAPAMGGDVFDGLLAETSSRVKKMDKVEDVSIDKFLKDILPTATSIEVLLENQHSGNFVSLIAPEDATAGKLFKWNNPFSWSYNGELADSMKERVKKAGGNVTGELCFRLAWDNTDDLDFHMTGPGGEHIYYGNRGQRSVNGGILDVDANGRDGLRPDPAENIYYASCSSMREGQYILAVNQFSKRNADKFGFRVEIDYKGVITSFEYPKAMASGSTVQVAKMKYTRAGGLEIIESLPSTQSSKIIWGLPTQTFHRVNTLMLSPNYWDGEGVGNKHYFFMLEGAVNDGEARGFYNEFLDSRLTPHRKVFEMVSSKTKPVKAAEQLSGLGFSSTQKDSRLTVRVKGSFTRTLNVVF